MDTPEWLSRKDDERRRQLQKAKEQAGREGKEAFDFAKFVTLYGPAKQPAWSSERLDPDVVASEWEAKYYLDFPDVKSVLRFAIHLDKMREAEEVQAAKQRATRDGKEPFDFAKLLTLFDPSSEMSSSVLHDPDATAREYEAKYYLDYSDVNTMAEFAELLDQYRSWGCDRTSVD